MRMCVLHQSKSTRPFPPGHGRLDANVVRDGKKTPAWNRKEQPLEMQEEHLEPLLKGPRAIMMTQSTSFPHFRTSWPLGSAVSRTSSLEPRSFNDTQTPQKGSRGIDMMRDDLFALPPPELISFSYLVYPGCCLTWRVVLG